MMRRNLLVAFAAALLAAPAQAQLAGETLGLQYRFPNQGDVWADYGTAVVGAGVEFQNVIGAFDVDVSGTSIFVDFSVDGSFTASAFNGFRLYDVFSTAPDFINFFVVSSNVAGFNISRLSFDHSDNLYVNFSGLTINPDSHLELGVTTTPEPATVTLMATGFMGLVGAARRRRKQQA